MHINKAVKAVRDAIGATFERVYSSPTAAKRPERVAEIDASIKRLRGEFDSVSATDREVAIWPKMIAKHQPDGAGGLVAVWGPISDSSGHILGVRVLKKNVTPHQQSTRVYVEWHPPEVA